MINAKCRETFVVPIGVLKSEWIVLRETKSVTKETIAFLRRLPVEFQRLLTVRIGNNQPVLVDSEWDWAPVSTMVLLIRPLLRIDTVLSLTFGRNFSSSHYTARERATALSAIVSLVYDILHVDFETKPKRKVTLSFVD